MVVGKEEEKKEKNQTAEVEAEEEGSEKGVSFMMDLNMDPKPLRLPVLEAIA